jgi:hypothetical protein
MNFEGLFFLSYGYAALFSTPASQGLSIYTPFKDNSLKGSGVEDAIM